MFWLNVAHAADRLTPPKASNFAGSWDLLYEFLVWASVISCILLIGGMIYFAMKYRRRTDNDKTAYISHNTFLEFLWSFIPFVIFMVVFAWGWLLFHEMRTAPEDALEVHVYGQKWSWEFRYKSGRKEMNHLYVPVDEDVKLIMTSRDVLHSFFVPSFRVKNDVVPGKYSSLWFRATKLGDFNLFCTEFCGDGHSRMLGTVHVLTRKEYDEWLQDNPREGLTPVQIGEQIYNTNCMICHDKGDKSGTGPGFKGLWGANREFEPDKDGNKIAGLTVDEEYIRESLLQPDAKWVKGFKKGGMVPQVLDDDEIFAVIEFLKTLN